MDFSDAVWFIFISFAFIAYLMVMFTIIGDLFRDPRVGGGEKALWIVLLIFFPLLTAIVYLVTRGDGMNERRTRDVEAVRAQQEDYIRSVSSSASPADSIARAKRLLDAGTITPAEYDLLKAKALA
jgi:phospholipase D-like protein